MLFQSHPSFIASPPLFIFLFFSLCLSLSQCPLPAWRAWHALVPTQLPAWTPWKAHEAALTITPRKGLLPAQVTRTKPDHKPWRCPAKSASNSVSLCHILSHIFPHIHKSVRICLFFYLNLNWFLICAYDEDWCLFVRSVHVQKALLVEKDASSYCFFRTVEKTKPHLTSLSISSFHLLMAHATDLYFFFAFDHSFLFSCQYSVLRENISL